MSAVAIVAYLALFAAAAFLFLFVALLLGRLLRPSAPTAAKLDSYECGEPPVGTSFVQFDLRFYVVALVFIIFEVEAAFFFPWATVFGKVTRLMDPAAAAEAAPEIYAQLGAAPAESAGEAALPAAGQPQGAAVMRDLALASMADIGVFFAVLLVGFAYVWKRGDLSWVRAIDRRAPLGPARGERWQRVSGERLKLVRETELAEPTP